MRRDRHGRKCQLGGTWLSDEVHTVLIERSELCWFVSQDAGKSYRVSEITRGHPTAPLQHYPHYRKIFMLALLFGRMQRLVDVVLCLERPCVSATNRT